MRSLTCGRLRSLIFGAFSLAVPDRMPAAPAGSSSIVNVTTTDDRTHRTRDGRGQSGRRRRRRHAASRRHQRLGRRCRLPQEHADRDHRDRGADRDPALRPAARIPAAPGVGAAAWRRRWISASSRRDTRITARNRDRSRFRALGHAGRRAAAPSDFILNPGTNRETRLGNTDTAAMEPGDVIQIRSAGGGGRGDPLDREPGRVARDVERGYVSEAAARSDYGVVLTGGKVNEPATAALRAKAHLA